LGAKLIKPVDSRAAVMTVDDTMLETRRACARDVCRWLVVLLVLVLVVARTPERFANLQSIGVRFLVLVSCFLFLVAAAHTHSPSKPRSIVVG
jgi:hypothetical protein